MLMTLVDPRITHLVPIIGSPSTLTLLEKRAAGMSPPIPFEPPYVPLSLLKQLKRDDPTHVPLTNWKGKKLLIMSGGADTLVPYDVGGSQTFVKRLLREAKNVDCQVYVQDGIGHRVTVEMLDVLSEWLASTALKPDTASKARTHL